MVAAANPLATQAGYQMLKQGGSAIDAAIATQLVLTLVEPQSSGIGGGSFLMYSDGKRVQSYDGRETAPAARTNTCSRTRTASRSRAKPAWSAAARPARRACCACWNWRTRSTASCRGKPCSSQPIKLAENGFAVSPRLNALLSWDKYLSRDPVARAYFFDAEGKPRPVGYVLKNPELARTLREIADGGADAFYKGRIASDIAAKVASHPTNPGKLTAADIAGYQAKERDPSAATTRSGPCAARRRHRRAASPSRRCWAFGEQGHQPVQAGRRPADGRRHPPVHRSGPPGLRGPQPLRGRHRLRAAARQGRGAMLDKGYLKQRAALIGEQSMGTAKYGTPDSMQVAWGADTAIDKPSTSHLVAVDAYGGGLSMTTSVEDAFGARQMVDGFMLNNQLTDFSFDSQDANGPIANRVQPGKRPRSAMSPTLVFDKGTHKLVLATGSPGGSTIINYVAKVLVGTLDWGLDVQQAISLPNIGSRNGPTELEAGRVSREVVDSSRRAATISANTTRTPACRASSAAPSTARKNGSAAPIRAAKVSF
jgi:gamma-glutamyltranspeptidase/glutathione hydrolase